MFENTKALCQRFLEMGVPFLDVLVYQNGKEIFRHKAGFTDPEKTVPVRGDERYNIYSCSKPITVTAAMQLWEKGLFDLDDKLSKYMPEFENMTVLQEDGTVLPAKNPILVRQLFTMTAGFSYDLHSPWLEQLRVDTEGRCPTREVARYLAKEPLRYEPGTKYLYSLGHDVLAALVEVLSGEKYENYVKKHIFDPLGMERSTFLLDPQEYDGLVNHFVYKDGQAQLRSKWPAYRLGTEHASGGAGCVSTVEDYMKFMEGVRTFKLLKRETIEVITRDWHNEDERKFYPGNAYYYGLGVRVHTPGTDLKDFGWGGAAGATLHIDIPNGVCVYMAEHITVPPNRLTRARIYVAVMKDLGYDVELVMPSVPEA